MCPRLYHLAFMNHSYHIRVVDGREMVSNDNGGSSLSGFIENFLDKFLALCVEGRGGFIKKENLGFRTRALAMAILCFCPPLSWVPLFPTLVAYPYNNTHH